MGCPISPPLEIVSSSSASLPDIFNRWKRYIKPSVFRFGTLAGLDVADKACFPIF